MDKLFLKKYLNDLSKLVSSNEETVESLINVKTCILNANKKGNKTLIFGNGGSAAIASHFSVDITKNGGIRCINFNESDLITCFSNDYGYDKWVSKAIEFYGDPGDVLIVISSSGQSKNMILGCDTAFEKKFSSIITFTGFNSENPLRSKGNINLWISSSAYNYVENIHQIWLLAVVDLIIGSKEYSA